MEALEASCPVPTGTYKTKAVREAMEGTCGWAKPESHDELTFDEHGALDVAGLASCRSTMTGCQLSVRCTSDLFGGVTSTLRATMAEDGESFTGRAVANGDFQDCRRVVYRVEARR